MEVRGCLDWTQCVLLCGRISDCNDCSMITGLISERATQSCTITVQILWYEVKKFSVSKFNPIRVCFPLCLFFYSILAMTACMDKGSNLMYTLVEVFTFKMFT